MSKPASPTVLSTSVGEFPLAECRVHVGNRDWAVLYTGSVLTSEDEVRFLTEEKGRLPYGVTLWPAGLALAHEVATRADAFRGKSVLELGAGVGLPGIVAASLGAAVMQVERQEVAMHVCRLNAERNGVVGIDYRMTDWDAGDDAQRFDWVIGSDILYAEAEHAALEQIFEARRAPGGRVLVADPFRAPSLRLLEALEAKGWRVSVSKWTIGVTGTPRPVGIFELTAG